MNELDKIVQAIHKAGGTVYEVGGCVRDQILGYPNKDLDLEVFHLDASELRSVLARFGRINEVGVSFGVIKLRTRQGQEIDFTLPRRESKTGRGHRGFQVQVDHTMTVEQAALRRDFTINAIYRNAHDRSLHDPHGGIPDLHDKKLRATSQHFSEDPLRVLRGMQFAARFDAVATPETIGMCRSLSEEYSTLAIERIWIEWSKWATKGIKPSAGLRLLQDCGWIEHYPELKALQGVPQDPTWHPEGDVWTHTLLVCDAAAAIAQRESLSDEERLILLFSALCHDMGKPATTRFEDGRWRSPAHSAVGVPIAEAFLTRIGCTRSIIEVILPLVAEHLIHAQRSPDARLVRRLAVRLGKANLQQLARLVEADIAGRPPLQPFIPESMLEMLSMASTMNIVLNKPSRIIQGRHLIELGHPPSPWFGRILDECFEAQLDGVFEDEQGGRKFLQELLRSFSAGDK